MYKTLANLEINQLAQIKTLDLDKDMQKRLNDLGIFSNVLIKCIFNSPFKDPKAYLINDTLIALRNIDAKKIGVKLINE